MKITKNSLFKKLLPVAVVGAGLAVAGPAMASWSASAPVTALQQSRSSYDGGRTLIWLENTPCSTGKFYISNSSSNKDIQIKLLTASLLAGNSVKLGYSAVADGCDVYSVQIVTN